MNEIIFEGEFGATTFQIIQKTSSNGRNKGGSQATKRKFWAIKYRPEKSTAKIKLLGSLTDELLSIRPEKAMKQMMGLFVERYKSNEIIWSQLKQDDFKHQI